jgi:excisionase family DNA binding protein
MSYTTIRNATKETPLLTVSEAAEFLNVHPNTLRRWCDIGLLMSYRISSRGDRRFFREDLMQFLNEYKTQKEKEQL